MVNFAIIWLISYLIQSFGLIPHYSIAKNLNSIRKFTKRNSDIYNNSPTTPAPIKLRSAEWAKQRGMEPGFGGVWPGDPNAPTYNVTFTSTKTSETFTLMVPNDRYIYHFFEEMGVDLPVINKAKMCRQGCCTICAVKLTSGVVKMDAPLGLLKDMRERGYALSCCSLPRSDITCELQDEDFTYIKQWGEGFEGGGVAWGGFLPDDD